MIDVPYNAKSTRYAVWLCSRLKRLMPILCVSDPSTPIAVFQLQVKDRGNISIRLCAVAPCVFRGGFLVKGVRTNVAWHCGYVKEGVSLYLSELWAAILYMSVRRKRHRTRGKIAGETRRKRCCCTPVFRGRLFNAASIALFHLFVDEAVFRQASVVYDYRQGKCLRPKSSGR